MDSRDAILVLEDQSLFCDLQSRFLATAGRVVTAANASEGLAAARRERPVVIVAALELADSSGEAVCKEIKSDRELKSTSMPTRPSWPNIFLRLRPSLALSI